MIGTTLSGNLSDKLPLAARTSSTTTASTRTDNGAEASKRTGNSEQATATAASKSSATAALAQFKAQQNVEIVQSSVSVSLSSGNEPLALMLKSAIQGINEALAPTLGPDAIQNAMSQDNSPQGTADRILSLSTGFFEAYAKQNPDKDPETLVKDFVATIRGGFERGFNEASDILKGLNALGDDIKGSIDQTYALVQKGYDDFIASKTKELTGGGDVGGSTSADAGKSTVAKSAS